VRTFIISKEQLDTCYSIVETLAGERMRVNEQEKELMNQLIKLQESERKLASAYRELGALILSFQSPETENIASPSV
jgi:hypothetical protein